MDRVTRDLEEMVARQLRAAGLDREPEPTGLTGEIAAGDYVKTLHLKHALYANVLRRKGARAWIEGRTQPGQPLRRLECSVENLELLERGTGAEVIAADAE